MKSKRGRPPGIHTPIKYFTAEERKAAISKSKSKWIIKKPWHCKDYNRTYILAGKHLHLKTRKHQNNIID